MRRSTSILTVIGVLVAILSLAAPVVAQDDIVAVKAAHPIVGAWIVDSSPDDPSDPLELTVTGPGGTITDTSLDGVGTGAWFPTGPSAADATVVFPAADPDAGFIGWVTIRTSVEVAPDGLSFSGTYTIEFPAAVAEAMGMTPGQMGPEDVSA